MDFFSVLSHLDQSQIGQLTLQHLLLVLVAVGLAILVGVSLGVLMTRFTRLAGSLQGTVTVMPTIPSIVLFGLLMPAYPVFGQDLGPLLAITTVFLYSLLLILRNAYLALTDIETGTCEADRGVDITFWQRLQMVDIPLAMLAILAGVHTAVMMDIDVITIVTVADAGGLGVLILTSIGQSNMLMLVVGTVLVGPLAIVTDLLLQWL